MIKPFHLNGHNQPQVQYYNQQIPQKNPHSVFFNDQQRARIDRS